MVDHFRTAVDHFRMAADHFRTAVDHFRMAAGHFRTAAGYFRTAVAVLCLLLETQLLWLTSLRPTWESSRWKSRASLMTSTHLLFTAL